MTTHGGNRKRGLNRPMRENHAGGFLRKLGQKCEIKGTDLIPVPSQYTSQTCYVCGNIDKKSRLTRNRFVCTICKQESHADVNVAYSNRFPCMGRQSMSSWNRWLHHRTKGAIVHGAENRHPVDIMMVVRGFGAT